MLACYASTRFSTRILLARTFDISSTITCVRPFPGPATDPWSSRRYATADNARNDSQGRRSQQVYAHKGTGQQPAAVGKSRQFTRTDLEQEIRYLGDPLKLARNILNLLRQDEHVKALEIVRLASRTIASTVSWNHIIDYNLTKGRVSESLKIYNEMKKRAQPPDARTYTMILRGLAQYTHYPLSLQRALSIYHSMFAENSPVRPSIIHTNAVLKVCARAEDMDSLFGIAAKLPTKGNGAPDNKTFTIILNTLRVKLRSESHTIETPEEKLARRQRHVLQGRRIWGDIIERWRDNDILIDEEMVCSMGRLLLSGSRDNDCDDVLSLVEQTMDIPRQIPRLGDPARKTHLTSIQFRDSDTTVPGSSGSNQPVQEAEILDSSPSFQLPHSPPESATPSPGSEFDPLPPSTKNILSFARPGRNALSLLMDACIRMRLATYANAYRRLLTSPAGPYKVTPDSENLHMHLRVLRQTRSSRNAADVVSRMIENPPPGAGVQAKTFRIAMSTCVRDIQNPDVGKTALRLLRMMGKGLVEPDMETCEMFLRVMERDGEDNAREIMKGLREMNSVINNWRSLLAFGRFDERSEVNAKRDEAEEEDQEDVEVDEVSGKKDISLVIRTRRTDDAFASGTLDGKSKKLISHLVRRMIGAYDKVIFGGGEDITDKERRDCKTTRAALARWVTRQHIEYNTQEQGLPGQPPAAQADDEDSHGHGNN